MASLTERDLSQSNKIGRREELANLIALVDAKDTPFTSMAKKGAQPGQTFFRWQADRLPTAALPTPVVDGTAETVFNNYVKDGATQYRVELNNRIQIFREKIQVSRLTQSSVTNIAGVRDELSNNVSKALLRMKRNMEITFTSAQASQADNGTVGYATRGLDKWLVASADMDAELPAAASAFCLPAGSIDTTAVASLTETNVQNVLTSIYEQTGRYRDYDLLCGVQLKRAFTNFVFTTPSSGTDNSLSAVRTLTRSADTDTYISSVDVFQGDFGSLRLHPSLFLKNSRVGYVIPFESVEIRYGGNVAEIIDLPEDGSGPRKILEAVAGLCIHNPLNFAKFDPTA